MKKILPLLIASALIAPHASHAAPALSVSAKSAIVMSSDGDVLFEHNADEVLPMASTTKIMTCLIALEECDDDEVVTVTDASAGIEGTSLYMKSGDEATVRDLIFAAMLRSANDAASALAVHISGDEESFSRLMNDRASELGLDGTHFTNPHGLPSEGHHTTARDLARLAAFAMKNELFAAVVSTKEYVVTLNGDEKRPVRNHNKLLFTYDGACGVKTGFTKESGRCLVSCAERDGVRLIAVTLGAPDDWRDHRAMLDYGFENLVYAKVLSPGQIRREFHVFGDGVVTAVNTEALFATVRVGSELSYVVEGDRFASLPVKRGDVVARVRVMSDGRAVGCADLVSTDSHSLPPRETLVDKIKKLFG